MQAVQFFGLNEDIIMDYITTYNARAYTAGREGHPITGIVIHHYGQLGATYTGTIRTLTSSQAASAHFVIDDHRAAQLVNLNDTAWHANNWSTNLTTIGIECPPEATAAQQAALVTLVAGIYKHYGKVLPLSGHRDHAATACPGRWYALLADIQRRAAEAAFVKPPDPLLPAWAAAAAEWAVNNGLILGRGGPINWAEHVTLARLAVILHRLRGD